MFDLTGKTALVTGATQGIGLEIAKELSQHGAKVFVLGASSMQKCQKAAENMKNAVPVQADISQVSEIEALHNVTGNVDILVLNASMQTKKSWDAYTEKDFEDHVNTNVKSAYFLMKAYIPGMVEKGFGRVVAVGSVNQFNQHPLLCLYGMTKTAQCKLVKNIAPLVAPYGVTVNNISPGAIATPRNEAVLSDQTLKTSVEEKIPCGYVGTPKDVAPAVLFLCSKEARYITGADLSVDGGMSL